MEYPLVVEDASTMKTRSGWSVYDPHEDMISRTLPMRKQRKRKTLQCVHSPLEFALYQVFGRRLCPDYLQGAVGMPAISPWTTTTYVTRCSQRVESCEPHKPYFEL